MQTIAMSPISAGTAASHNDRRRDNTPARKPSEPARPEDEARPLDNPPPLPVPLALDTIEHASAAFTAALLANELVPHEIGWPSSAAQERSWLAPDSELRLRDRKI
ncbi:hypothetical protein GCM10007989_06820 [Devosia pacifica]|uniref:Uncharacterized protein n=1 Tax=Devosia pacifica TaxID=1335967 RepID=A0A918VQ38_9HYPH|nr:hypothetical protein [Devosia pacifica]GHA14757.1 hypothetical protein GCM10007989_06820 [Devosia pacifica]